MRLLGIETSCDETAAAVVDGDTILSNVILSQRVHVEYGGVVPELASRSHITSILPVIRDSLHKASLALGEMEGIAVTQGPGLVGSLLVGLCVGKALAYGLEIPFVGVNHLEGHIFANFIEHPHLSPPFVCLIASGGHTSLIQVIDRGEYLVLGRTKDDAAGEAFDKVAKFLGLYPPEGPAMGGPLIARLATSGDPAFVRFPRAMVGDANLDFSFSGLKTAVVNFLDDLSEFQRRRHIEDICASFQMAVVDVLVEKCLLAAETTGLERIALAGGVSGNSLLRETLEKEAKARKLELFYPSPVLCTDNAAMIAAAGQFHLSRGERSDLSLNAVPGLALGDEKR